MAPHAICGTRFFHISVACGREADENFTADWHLAKAMMRGYMRTYGPAEDFEVVDLEKVFNGKIFNPETGASSRSFDLAGKVDGIVKIDGEYWLLEHKTASVIDSGYLERLWMDTQIILYSHYIEKTMGIKITGVLYNILAKARLKQSTGETEEEFQARRAELIAKSKTGKSTAKRKMPETDEDFAKRLNAKYEQPNMFHRERPVSYRTISPQNSCMKSGSYPRAILVQSGTGYSTAIPASASTMGGHVPIFKFAGAERIRLSSRITTRWLNQMKNSETAYNLPRRHFKEVPCYQQTKQLLKRAYQSFPFSSMGRGKSANRPGVPGRKMLCSWRPNLA